MKRAILYTRDNIGGRDYQKSKLVKYCKQNDIEIVGYYRDAATGSHFNRLGWLKLRHYIAEHPGQVDLILFTTWDRLSRNAPATLEVIKELEKKGVELLAVEPSRNSVTQQELVAFHLASRTQLRELAMNE